MALKIAVFIVVLENAAVLSLVHTRVQTYTSKATKLSDSPNASTRPGPLKGPAARTTDSTEHLNVSLKFGPANIRKGRDLADLVFHISHAKHVYYGQRNRDNESGVTVTQSNRVRRRLSQGVVPLSLSHVPVRSFGTALSSCWLCQHKSYVARLKFVYAQTSERSRSSIAVILCVTIVLALLILAPLGLWLSRDVSLDSTANTMRYEESVPRPGKILSSHNSKKESEESACSIKLDAVKRTCYVCMDDPITTASLPCRHSSMCTPCMAQVFHGSRRCPLCRGIIDTWLEGEYATDFVDFAPSVVAATANRICDVRTVVYDGMYDHIRCLVVIGFLEASLSVFFFWKMQSLTIGFNLGTMFAVMAVLTGYIPWFSVTVAAFEREERSDGSRQTLLSGADCARPHLLLMKALLIVILAPLALVMFFLPYMLLVIALRPFKNYVLPWLVRTSLYVFFDICFYSFMYVFRPCFVASRWIIDKSGRGLMACLKFLWTCFAFLWSRVLVPTVAAIGNCIVWAANALHSYVMVPVGKAAHAIGIATYDYVLTPLGRGLVTLGRGVYEYILTPLGHCIAVLCHWLCQLATITARGVASAATFLYLNGILPVARLIRAVGATISNCVVAVSSAFGRGLVAVLERLYQYVVVPIAWCIGAAAHAVYANVLVPIAKGIGAAAYAVYAFICCPLGRCLSAVAAGFYEYVLSPSVRGVAAAADALYVYVLVPLGTAIRVVCATIASVIWAIFTVIASACSAAGQWIAQIARGVATSMGL